MAKSGVLGAREWNPIPLIWSSVDFCVCAPVPHSAGLM